MCDKISLVLITGLPGVGKTTITKKLYNSLNAKQIQCFGFYTEECRTMNGERNGFDILTLDNKERHVLARCESGGIRRPKVGKYSVYLDEFEKIALKTLQNFSLTDISNDSQIMNRKFLIIDEIGKMELLSKKFEIEVRKLIEKIKCNDIKMIATIPNPNRNQLKIVEELLSLSNGKLFTITKQSRNEIYNEIEKLCLDILN